MKTVAEVIGVSRSNLVERLQRLPPRRIGWPPLPDEELVAQIKAAIAELPTYGYPARSCHPQAPGAGRGLKAPNHKRVYWVMKVHGLLLGALCRWCRAPA
jgi:putative transposase